MRVVIWLRGQGVVLSLCPKIEAGIGVRSRVGIFLGGRGMRV